MILSYPLVDGSGAVIPGEVSFKLNALLAIQPLCKYNYDRNLDREIETVVEGCCTLFIDRNEFNVKADYQEILAILREHSERYETVG